MISDGVPLQSLGAVKRGEHDPIVIDGFGRRARRHGRRGAVSTIRSAGRWPARDRSRPPGTGRSPPPWPPARVPVGRWCGPARRCWTSACRGVADCLARTAVHAASSASLAWAITVGTGPSTRLLRGGVDLTEDRLVGLAVAEHRRGHGHHLRGTAMVLVEPDDFGAAQDLGQSIQQRRIRAVEPVHRLVGIADDEEVGLIGEQGGEQAGTGRGSHPASRRRTDGGCASAPRRRTPHHRPTHRRRP